MTKKPEWRSFVGTGAELFWRDFAADGLLDEADKAREATQGAGIELPTPSPRLRLY